MGTVRNRLSAVIATLVVLNVLFPLARTVGAESALHRRPNIILIMADDFGYECVTCNGGESYQTPRLDAMAAGGMRFSECHSQPVCTPTRVQIMTGRCNSRNYWAFGSLHPKELTFGHILGAAGYATCIAGKWQLSGRGDLYPGTHPDESGFDEWCLWELDEETGGSRYWSPTIKANGKLLQDTAGEFGPDIFCNYLLDFISQNKNGPFFAYYPMALTHGPTHPTPDTPGYDPSTKPQRKPSYFADMVSYTDKIVGRVLDHLEREGLAEDTLVLFTGDNGTDKKLTSQFQGRTVRGGKGRKLDVSTHVPLIASWRGTLPAGRVCNDLIDVSDMLPTFVQMSGANVPDGLKFDGVSFLPQLRGESGTPKPYIYCYYEKGKYDGEAEEDTDSPSAEEPEMLGERKFARRATKSGPTTWVHDGRWKLLNSGNFYDLVEDPEEQSPIAKGEAGPEGERKRALFEKVLQEKSKIRKEYGPAELTDTDQSLGSVPEYLIGFEKLYREDPHAAAVAWFRDAKFGLFVHYALASVLEGGKPEYVKLTADLEEELGWSKLSVGDRQQLGADEARVSRIQQIHDKLASQFRAECFNAEAICDLALAAEMRYVNFTTKHLGRMAMYRTTTTDFNSLNSPAGRDLVAELAEACRKRGLGLFLYVPPETARTDGEFFDVNRRILRELLTQYGPIAGIWFDGIGHYRRNPENYTRLSGLFALVRELQPQCLVSFKEGALGTGDFVSPEHFLLPTRIEWDTPERQERWDIRLERWRRQDEALWKRHFSEKPAEINTVMQECHNRDGIGEPGGWINDENARHLTADEVMYLLDVARRLDANLLLNIGPRGDGSIHPLDKQALLKVGRRLRKELEH